MAKILMNFADYLHTPERKKQNTYGGIGYYRTIKPSQQIKGHEVRVIGKEILHFGNTLEEQWDNVFKEYDVYWISYFSNDTAGAAMIYYAQKHKKKIVIDVDDNYLDVPESNEMYDKFKKTKKDRAYLSTILSFADVITVSTEPLKEKLYNHFKMVHGMEKKIVVIPNMNDIKDWDFIPAPKHEDKVVIGYTGSNSHMDDLKMVMPSIATIMKKYPNVYLEVLGAIPKDKIKEYFGGAGFNQDCLMRINMLPATATFKEYPEYLSEQKWDIGICPLVDSAFTRAKSHIKWLEYSMYKIPVVASRVYPYFMELKGKQTIEDGVTGFLCKPKDWVATLERLIENKKLREEIGNNAYEYIKKEWQYDTLDWSQIINEIVA
jgi:glycosyltransferase involved in cell wall biosynthesis